MLEYVCMTSYASSGAPPLRHVYEPERRTPVRWEGDVVVLGGGAAGLAAAVAAAREGASVLLVERFGYLGGVMTAVSLGTICGIYGIGADDKPYPLVAGIAQEVVDRLRQCDGAAAPRRWLGAVTVPYDVFSLKVVLDDMAKQAGVRLAFHVQLVDCIAEGEKVQAAILQDKSGRWAARARVFVDATGDADLVAMSGDAYEYEPEEMQLPSTTFRLCAVDDTAARAVTRENLRHRMEEAIRQGWDLPRSCGGVYFHKPGMAHLNITRVSAGGRSPNPLDTFELTDAELEGRRQVRRYQQAFATFVPGYERSYVVDSGAHIGIRESRRIVGDYRLDIADIRAGARFEDAIASCAWPVEVHERGTASTRWDWLPPGVHYQIPLRCLMPRGYSNVIVAGRCISSSHEAHGSLRVTATCMAMGQAAGAAAALAARATAGSVRDLGFAPVREALTRQGAIPEVD
jgi:flavin-dependent dehydrogenase